MLDEKNCALNEEEVAEVTGGGNDWRGAHWQDTRHKMGTDWWEHRCHWYRINFNDTLGQIAIRFHTTPNQIKAWNPMTIQDINVIAAGDAIIVGK